MKLRVVTPERVVLEADGIEALYANTTDGEVGILPQHVPMVAPLAVGVVRYVQNGQKSPLAVMGGMLRTDGVDIAILCDAAEQASEIDTMRAEQSRQRAETLLKQQTAEVDLQRAKAALTRALTRLKVTQPVS